jgi:hypothetical protein
MSAKLFVLFGLMALARAGIPVATYIAPQPSHGWQQPSNGWNKQPIYAAEAPANYNFNYEVQDQHTGDIKAQSEKAHDGKVVGQYWLIDADGYKRIVDYTADDHNGFQATVRREPVQYQIPQKVVVAPQYVNGWQQKPANNGWQKPKW